MRKAISLAALALLLAGRPAHSLVDAYARAAGNDRPDAVRIGQRLFAREWSAQVLKVYVDAVGTHRVAGLLLSGVKFHHPLTQAEFSNEAFTLIRESFAAAPVEEVDLWCDVPLGIGKGVVVSGDYAKPTQRIVFTITVRRGESAGRLRQRMQDGKSVYWDAEWVRRAFRPRAVRG
ncbi:MAG: hypothetical protein NVS1B14_02950 [Vulcanimicrobiaceae bacterium]